ncbi:MAG: hypothetical protein ABIP14_05275 [Blastocatellia bacterium]
MALPFQLPPQTLHLDSQRAWRQGEDAIFLPIVYDFHEHNLRYPETMIVQAIATDLPADFLGREEKRKNFASLKRKAETGDFHIPQANRQNQPEIDPIFDNPDPPKSKRLFKSVLTLLLSVIALVFFAWIVFR